MDGYIYTIPLHTPQVPRFPLVKSANTPPIGIIWIVASLSILIGGAGVVVLVVVVTVVVGGAVVVVVVGNETFALSDGS